MSDELIIRSIAEAGSIRLAQALKAKASGLTCRVCGGRDFGLVEAPDEGWRTTLTRSHIADNNDAMRIQQTLVTVICTRCGHVLQFAEAILNGAVPSQYGEDRCLE
jgi:ribosomal protein L37E